jgi:hypothetical protein
MIMKLKKKPEPTGAVEAVKKNPLQTKGTEHDRHFKI